MRAGPLVRGRWPWGPSRQYSHFLLLLPSCFLQAFWKLEGQGPIGVLHDSRGDTGPGHPAQSRNGVIARQCLCPPMIPYYPGVSRHAGGLWKDTWCPTHSLHHTPLLAFPAHSRFSHPSSSSESCNASGIVEVNANRPVFTLCLEKGTCKW